MRIAAVGSEACGGGDGAEGAVAKSSRSDDMERAWVTLDVYVKIILLLDDQQVYEVWSTGRELHSKPWIWNTRVLPYLCLIQYIQWRKWKKEQSNKKFRLWLHGCSTFLDAQGPFTGTIQPESIYDGELFKVGWLFATNIAKYWFDFMPLNGYSKLFLRVEYTNDDCYREDIIHIKRLELTARHIFLNSIVVHGSVVMTQYFDRKNDLHQDYF